MSSRALILATVLLLLCAFAPGRSLAQENLDAGKSPSQLFAGTCNVCHKSPRGLLKTVSPSSLPSFLRQHYTTSPNMAGVLASYLVSNGATDTRYGEAAKGAKGAKEGTKEGAKEGAREGIKEGTREAARERQEAARQRSEGEPGTQGHSQANPDHADGRNGAAKQRLSKRGRPEEFATPSIEPKSESKPDPKSEPKPEPASAETAKPEIGQERDGIEGGRQQVRIVQARILKDRGAAVAVCQGRAAAGDLRDPARSCSAGDTGTAIRCRVREAAGSIRGRAARRHLVADAGLRHSRGDGNGRPAIANPAAAGSASGRGFDARAPPVAASRSAGATDLSITRALTSLLPTQEGLDIN